MLSKKKGTLTDAMERDQITSIERGKVVVYNDGDLH